MQANPHLRLAAVLAITLLAAIPALAQSDQRFGAGLGVGEPTGLYLKYWTSDANAIGVGIGYAFAEESKFQIHGDYLWHRYEWLRPKDLPGTLPVYFGVGMRIRFADDDNGNGRGNDDHDNDDHVGIRLPLGLNYRPYTSPFDVFAEIVPVLDVTPEADLDINVAVGTRYYF